MRDKKYMENLLVGMMDTRRNTVPAEYASAAHNKRCIDLAEAAPKETIEEFFEQHVSK